MAAKTYRVVRTYMNSPTQKPPRILATGQNEGMAQHMCMNPVPENPPANLVPAMQNSAPQWVQATELSSPNVPAETYIDNYELES